MASPKKFAMQEVFDIAIFDISTGDIEAYLEDVKTSGIEMTAETVYAMGGKGNPYLVGYSHSRRATATVTNALMTSEIFALQSGQPVIVGANTNVVKRDVLTVNSDTATTTYVALGDADDEIGVAYTLVGGVPDEKFTQGASVASGVFTYDTGTKTITFNTAEIADGTEIVVYYRYTTDATAQTIKFDADKFAGNKKVVFYGLATDGCSKDVFEAQVIFHSAKIGDNWTWDLAADGDPAVQNLDIEAVKGCADETLVEIVVFDNSLAS